MLRAPRERGRVERTRRTASRASRASGLARPVPGLASRRSTAPNRRPERGSGDHRRGPGARSGAPGPRRIPLAGRCRGQRKTELRPGGTDRRSVPRRPGCPAAGRDDRDARSPGPHRRGVRRGPRARAGRAVGRPGDPPQRADPCAGRARPGTRHVRRAGRSRDVLDRGRRSAQDPGPATRLGGSGERSVGRGPLRHKPFTAPGSRRPRDRGGACVARFRRIPARGGAGRGPPWKSPRIRRGVPAQGRAAVGTGLLGAEEPVRTSSPGGPRAASKGRRSVASYGPTRIDHASIHGDRVGAGPGFASSRRSASG